MAIIRAQSTRNLRAAIQYVLKPRPDNEGKPRYVMTSGVHGLMVATAAQQMASVLKEFGKDRNFVQAYPLVQSFSKDELDPDDPDAWEKAQQYGRAVAKKLFPGRLALVVTQNDGRTGCLHNHIIICSVATATGKSLDSSLVTHSRLAHAHDEILAEHGFIQSAELQQAAADSKDRWLAAQSEGRNPGGRFRGAAHRQHAEDKEMARYLQWEMTQHNAVEATGSVTDKEPFSVAILKHRIQQTLADPTVIDWESFVSVGFENFVEITERGKKKTISYGMLRELPDGSLTTSNSDKRREISLGEGFRREDVEEAWDVNRRARRKPQGISPKQAPQKPATTTATAPQQLEHHQQQPAQSVLDQQEITEHHTSAVPWTRARRRRHSYLMPDFSLEPKTPEPRAEDRPTADSTGNPAPKANGGVGPAGGSAGRNRARSGAGGLRPAPPVHSSGSPQSVTKKRPHS